MRVEEVKQVVKSLYGNCAETGGNGELVGPPVRLLPLLTKNLLISL